MLYTRQDITLHPLPLRRPRLWLFALLLALLTPAAAQNAGDKSKAAPQSSVKITVVGLVLDAHDEPLPGALVRIRNTKTAATTDAEGRFTLMVPQNNRELEVSFMGMETQTVRVKEAGKIVVHLKENQVSLNEVVVNGFYSQDKRTFTGSATTINRDELLKVSSTNVIKAITALTPGMTLVENNAAGSNPNAVPELLIRGANSLAISGEQGVNNPLIVLDGTEISLEDFYDMDINEIETVTVLKDASATILYGEKAANGVIVVERSRVKDSKVRLSYNFTPSFSYADLTSLNLTDAAQKLELERLAGLYDSESGEFDQAYAYKLQNVRRGVNTQWAKAPLRFSFSHSHSAALSGRGQNLDYRASLRFTDTYGVMKGDNRRNYGLNVYFGYHLTDKLTISYRANYAMSRSKNSPYGEFSTYTRLNPYEPIYDEEGEYIKKYYFNPFNPASSKGAIENPLYNATLSSFDKSENQSLTNSLDIKWYILPELYLTGQFDYRINTRRSDSYTSPDDSQYLETNNLVERGSYRIGGGGGSGWDGKFVLSYRKQFKPIAFSVNAGSDISSTETSTYSNTATGFLKDNLSDIKFALGYKANSKPSGTESISRQVGFFVNSNVVLLNRYFADLSYRTSGNSKNGADQRFGPFWSVGAGWNMHNETFMKSLYWLSTLRLRWSIGYTGSSNFNSYQAITTYQYNQADSYYTGMGAHPITMGNPNLKWQKTLKNNIGLTADLFRGRLNLTFDYYRNKTFDTLLPIDLPPSVGVSSVNVNLGELYNSGVDFSVSGRILKSETVYWSMTLNGGHNFDRIEKISNALEATNSGLDSGSTPKLLYKEGGSQYDIYAVRSAGIDPASGKEIFITKDGHYTYTYNEDDKVAVGNSNPVLQGSWLNTIQYKGFALSLTASYTFGGDIYNSTLYDKVENIDPYYNVDERAFTNRWKAPGDRTRFVGLREGTDLFRSERFVERKNEIYLSNVTFTYEFGAKALKKLRLKRLCVGISYDDAFRITTVKYERGTSYPYARSLNLIFRPTF